MESKKVVLSIRNLEIDFKVRNQSLNAIRRISLDLYLGETLAIVGESGSGKSVLIKSLTGMLEENGNIKNGEILFENQDLAKYKTHRQWQGIRGVKIATVFQDPMTALNPVRTIGSQLTEVILKNDQIKKKEAKIEAIKLMEQVGIKGASARFDDYPHQYSGGMRQRIVIAIALACHPKILLCDEPTTALDVTIQSQILQLIKELQELYHFTTIYITHDLGVVANVADRVAIMYAGQIIEYGEVEEIFYEPAHPYTWALLLSLPQLAQVGIELFAIGGTPPSLYHQIIGDAFAPRNQYAMQIDYEEEPPFFALSPTHYVKTWLADPRAPKIEMPSRLKNLHKTLKATYEKEGEVG